MTGAPSLRLAPVAATLAAVAAMGGLLVPGFYARDPAVLQPQLLGQDLVTLTLAAPLLLLSARAAARGSLRGEVAMAGLLLYLAYTYATYAFGVRFNALFPLYLAILGVSTFGFALAVGRLPPHRVTAEMWARLPRRALAAVLLAIAAAFTLLWGADIMPALLAGGAPQAAAEAQMPTSPIHVLDLAFVLPLAALAGVLLLRRDPWGPLLGGVMVVKAATLGLAVLSMALFSALAGQPVNAPVAVTMAAMVLGVLAVGWGALAALGPTIPAARPRAAGRRSRLAWATVPLLALIAVAALPVGWQLATVPSGASLGMDAAWLRASAFPDYRIPGVALLLLGLLHLAGVAAVLLRPGLAWVPTGLAGAGDMV